MTHFLDELPLDFSNPGVQDLVRILTDNYYWVETTVPLLQSAGIPLGAIDWNRSMDLAWPGILDEARRRGKLRTLLTVIASSPNTAVAGRINELLAASPVIPAPEPAESINWKIDPEAEGGLERQIESQPTLLDISFLERGLELAPSVARLLVTLSDGQYYGTAFRIGDNLLLTNHHVLFDRVGPATRVEAWFGYERSFTGADRAYTQVECSPTSIVGNPDHDWAIVRTANTIPTNAEIIPLTGADAPQPLDRVYIIQHPHGGVKKIGMIHNVVVDVTDDLIQYRTDTAGGSSGSPVFNEQWQVVGLHHRWGSREVAGRTEYFNQGQRIERVLAAMDTAGVL
jgi:V8-like Glu-specific endopeptidase